jgi:hypothetical protein
MLLSEYHVTLVQPLPIKIAEATVAITIWQRDALVLPDQLQGNMWVALQLLVDHRKVRRWILPPRNRLGPVTPQGEIEQLLILIRTIVEDSV